MCAGRGEDSRSSTPVEVEQVPEGAGVGPADQQRLAGPVLRAEGGGVQAGQPVQGGRRASHAGRRPAGRRSLSGSVRSAGTAVRAPVLYAAGTRAGPGVGRFLGPGVRAAVGPAVLHPGEASPAPELAGPSAPESAPPSAPPSEPAVVISSSSPTEVLLVMIGSGSMVTPSTTPRSVYHAPLGPGKISCR